MARTYESLKQEIAELGLTPYDWDGDTFVVPVGGRQVSPRTRRRGCSSTRSGSVSDCNRTFREAGAVGREIEITDGSKRPSNAPRSPATRFPTSTLAPGCGVHKATIEQFAEPVRQISREGVRT